MAVQRAISTLLPLFYLSAEVLTLHEWLVVWAVASLVSQCSCCENVLVGAVHNAQIGGGAVWSGPASAPWKQMWGKSFSCTAAAAERINGQ